MGRRDRNNTIELIMVMILLIIITMSIFLLIQGGGQSYKQIIANKDSFDKARIASSFINVKIKQNDYSESIEIVNDKFSNIPAIKITHHGDEEGLFTYLLFKDGYLYECYIDEFDTPSLSLSEIVVKVKNITFEDYKDGKGIVVRTSYVTQDNVMELRNIITFRTN
ncbi:MAG: DUF4860 domain-containing protein [Clostridiales bacterium]|nr:DUF4860 domain-containing protein [Clostridiales bacterium]